MNYNHATTPFKNLLLCRVRRPSQQEIADVGTTSPRPLEPAFYALPLSPESVIRRS